MGEVSRGISTATSPSIGSPRLAREIASRRFMGSPECQALVQAAFQRAAEAKLAGKAHSLEIEKQLLFAFLSDDGELPEAERAGDRTPRGRTAGAVHLHA